MRGKPGPHLGYCTNVHAGERWPEVRAALEEHVLRVRARVAPESPFSVGLRLSADAARTLDEDARERAALRGLLDAHQLYVVTLNGFPYGAFHGGPVKERVYEPDWREDARLAYTAALARVLAALLPEGEAGSISTVPVGANARIVAHAHVEQAVSRLHRGVAQLARIEAETGRAIALALEPEPGCLLETTGQVISFFERHLLAPAALGELAALAAVPPTEAEALVRRHLGVCLDACHLAVAFEDPRIAVRALKAAGIRIPKVQLSAGLEARFCDTQAPEAAALARFDEPVWLHQVSVEREGAIARFPDLPQALAALGRETAVAPVAVAGGGVVHTIVPPPSTAREPRTWRVHFHVPIDEQEDARLQPLRTTRAVLEELLDELGRGDEWPHLEVETYTWSALGAPTAGTLDDAIARELAWARARIGS